MKIIEYIRQLPGMKKIDDEQAGCLLYYGLDKHIEECPIDDLGFLECEKCMREEATIGGEPAPYLFSCPVKPEQTVYRATSIGVDDAKIAEVRFGKNGWYAVGYSYGDWWDGGTVCDGYHWMRCVFPTREAAENRLAEMRGESDGK